MCAVGGGGICYAVHDCKHLHDSCFAAVLQEQSLVEVVQQATPEPSAAPAEQTAEESSREPSVHEPVRRHTSESQVGMGNSPAVRSQQDCWTWFAQPIRQSQHRRVSNTRLQAGTGTVICNDARQRLPCAEPKSIALLSVVDVRNFAEGAPGPDAGRPEPAAVRANGLHIVSRQRQ